MSFFNKWRNKKRQDTVWPHPSHPPAAFAPALLNGVSDTIDVISPDGLYFPDWQELLEQKRGYVQVNSRRFTRVFQVKQHPSQVFMGYLNDFYSIGDVDISVHVYPGDPDQDVQDLTELIIKLETSMYTNNGKHSTKDAIVEASLRDTMVLRDNVSLNRDRLIYNSVYISVSAETQDELNKVSEEVERLAGRKMMRIVETFLEEDLGFLSVAPAGINAIEDNHSNFDLGASTALFPFDSPELTHPNGTFLGRNWHTGAPIFFNNFIGGNTLPAIHMNVIGRTRSGKSTFCKVLIARDACRGIITWVFDPDGEYGDVIRRVGGQEVKLWPGRFCGFNFCDIEPDDLENSNHLLAKIEEVKGVLLYMMERDGQFPITPEEESLLEQSIRREYETRGITDDPKSLMEKDTRPGAVGYQKKKMPTISSIAERLSEIGGSMVERMVTRLIPYRAEGTLGMFDGQTEIDLKGVPAVSFNLKALDALPRLKPLAMHILQTYTWEYFVKQDTQLQKRVLFDEAWLFTKMISSLTFFEQMSRRAAKRNCTFTLASQNFREFTKTNEGKVVLAQAGVSLLFQQHPSDLKEIQGLWDLPEGQIDFIRRLQQGDCLMRIGEQATAMHVEVMPYEQAFVFTTAGEWGAAPEGGSVPEGEEEHAS